MGSIDDCIGHLVALPNVKTETYTDGTKAREFRARKMALIVLADISEGRTSHFIYKKGRIVYFSQSSNEGPFVPRGKYVSGWRKDVRKLVKTAFPIQGYLPGFG